MRRFSGLFWFILVMTTGIGNFAVKHTVQHLDDELAAVKRKTVAEQKEVHELTADWTFLNQPELLADLNKRYIGLVPVSPKQVEPSVAAIPLRPIPPPDDTPPIIAAVPAAAPQPQAQPQAVAQSQAAAPVRASIIPIAAAGPARPAQPASLDALFAQVSGDR